MEKTMARAIYKRMEIGKEYSTYDLFRLIEDVYYSYIPAEMHGKDVRKIVAAEMHGKDVRKIVAAEMWKIVKAGFARTRTEQETLGNLRGVRYGTKPTSFTTYTFRYWVRTK